MKAKWLILCTLGLTLGLASARADGPPSGPSGNPYWVPLPGAPGRCPYPTTPGMIPQQPGQMPDQQPGQMPDQQPGQQPDQQPGANDNLAQTPPSGGDVPGSFNPQMIGDLGAGGFINTTVLVRSGSSSSATVTRRQVRIPIVGRSAFKIAENESPRPLDRAFITYNYFNGVPAGSLPSFDLHREVAGFEKTFLDGNASIGMRLPFLQQPGSAVGRADIGDLSIIGKYAFMNDRQTGNVMSAGLVVTVPTAGSRLNNLGGGLHDTTLIQPYSGWIYNYDRVFVQGFSSIIIPTDSSNPLLTSNDVGVGYRLLQGDCNSTLRYIIPTLEGHLTNPWTKRGLNSSPVGFPDTFIMTTGVHFGLFKRGNLTLGYATPLTGPIPFEGEGILQFNLIF